MLAGLSLFMGNVSRYFRSHTLGQAHSLVIIGLLANTLSGDARNVHVTVYVKILKASSGHRMYDALQENKR